MPSSELSHPVLRPQLGAHAKPQLLPAQDCRNTGTYLTLEHHFCVTHHGLHNSVPADRVRLREVTCFVDLPCEIFGVLDVEPSQCRVVVERIGS